MVETNLVGDGFDLGRCKQNLHLVDVEIAYSNTPKGTRTPITWSEYSGLGISLSEACLFHFFHFLPCRWDIWHSQARRMDKIQVYIRHPELSIQISYEQY